MRSSAVVARRTLKNLSSSSASSSSVCSLRRGRMGAVTTGSVPYASSPCCWTAAPPYRTGFLLRSSSSSSTDGSDDNNSDSNNPQHRHAGIVMHPDSISREILPGNLVVKKHRSGKKKQRYTELVHGAFLCILAFFPSLAGQLYNPFGCVRVLFCPLQ